MVNFSNGFRITGLFLIIFWLIFGFSFCSNNDTPDSDPTDGKTYLKIVNNTSFAVNVYINDPPLYDAPAETIRHVPAGGSQQWELQPTAAGSNGETLYFEYLIPIGSTTIPYYSNDPSYIKLTKLTAGIINTEEVPPLNSAQTDSIFILIKNDSSHIAWFLQGAYTINPFGSSVRDIPASGDSLFVFDSDFNSLSNCSVGNNTRRLFHDIQLQKGHIYTFIYDGTGDPGLFLIEQFDLNMYKNIWTIPTYVEPVPKGRFFTVGLLDSRQNPRTDGYILTGRVNYELATVTKPYIGAVPYLGMISPTGDIRERRINLIKNPAGLNLRRFIEDSNELVYVGQAYYEDTIGQPFILSTDTEGRENYFYDGFIDDMDPGAELQGYRLVKWDTNKYAVGCSKWEYDPDYGDWRPSIYIAKVNKISWDEVTHEEFWISPQEDYADIIELIYDQNHNMIIVLTSNDTGSSVYFLNTLDGSLKYPTVYLNNYWINGFFTLGQDYYVTGSYQGASRVRGFVTRIDFANGSVDTQNPWLIDSTKEGYNQGAVDIWYVLPENDGTLILAGWCVGNGYDAEPENYRPWFTKYNPVTRTKIWEQIYDSHEGYKVYSIHHNAIGSYLLETYNEATYHSYLISTDLLGNMSDNQLAPLPRNTSLFTASQPGNPGISVVITPMSPDVGFSSPSTLTLSKGQSSAISVSGTWASYQWYVNGTPVTGASSSYTFNTTVRNVGVYTVTVVVTNSVQEKYSASCRVTVTN